MTAPPSALSARRPLSTLGQFLREFLAFGVKEARACVFAGSFFLAVFIVPRAGVLGIPRYDLLLVIALLIQVVLVMTGIESMDEVKAITLFHIVGFCLELFKTSPTIGAWSYPDFAYTKIGGVPLFSGFMYAAVGSYIIQAWRLLDLRVRHHPPYWMAATLAILIYANFFTHHFMPDMRWYLAACGLGLYARTTVIFRPLDRDRWMPATVGFVLTGFFIWLAENISTFFGIWRYPNQMSAWAAVHVGKWSSWSLLVIMTWTIVANLKHVREKVHVPV